MRIPHGKEFWNSPLTLAQDLWQCPCLHRGDLCEMKSVGIYQVILSAEGLLFGLEFQNGALIFWDPKMAASMGPFTLWKSQGCLDERLALMFS